MFVQHHRIPGNTVSTPAADMLTTGSITTETFSAALFCLEDLSLRVTAVTLHVAAQPEHYPRLRKLFEELVDLMQICEDQMAIYPHP